MDKRIKDIIDRQNNNMTLFLMAAQSIIDTLKAMSRSARDQEAIDELDKVVHDLAARSREINLQKEIET